MINWIKNNKLSSFLILLLVIFIGRGANINPLKTNMMSLGQPASLKTGSGLGSASVPMMESDTSLYRSNYTPTTQADRIVIQETSLSLVVLKVQETVDKITDQAKQVGGYMVTSAISQPEESPYATVVIRIPSEKLKDTLSYLKGLSVKVVSENVNGTDVTDQYVDLQSRLDTLNKTKAKFESILNSATQVQDILTVQRELINLQDQIDSLKGQQKYLEQTAKLSKITISLSSDEMALPYAPTETFRPEVIFKTAIRSLVGALRGIAAFAIWIAVFGIIWVPVLGIIILIKRRKKRTS